jgi:hypothetical protein
MRRADVATFSRGRTIATRPAILEASRALGLPDALLADALNVSAAAVAAWAKIDREIPVHQALAAQFVIGRMIGVFGRDLPPDTVFARRSDLARKHAEEWLLMARDELPLLSEQEVAWGYKLGRRALRRIEKKEAM